jgi:hypothetical protein
MALSQYLDQLRNQLKDFPTGEQADLLAEISSHIESAEQDPSLGSDPHQRQRRIVAELGSPDDLGRNLKSVHRPARLVDFLLVFIPVYLLFPLVLPVLVRLFGTPQAWSDLVYFYSLRFEILLGLVISVLAVWRRSPLLLAFWVPDVMTRLTTLLFRERRLTLLSSPFQLENLLWLGLFAVLAVGLVRMLCQNRRDLLLVVFAILPFISSFFGVGSQLLAANNNVTQQLSYWNIGGISILLLVEIASLAGFFLLRRRLPRWIALWVGVLGSSAVMVNAFWPNPVLGAWWCAQAAIVLGLAWLDMGRRGVRVSL